MSDPTPGNTLVSGIQDISAFLPIVGTDQCERHVGEALTGGFLYAAATPLSIFGCLGIVKAGATILCASFSPRLAQMLADAGFNLEGSIAAMIGKESHRSMPPPDSSFRKVPPKVRWTPSQETVDTGDDQFVAKTKFLKLLEEQHISKEQVILEFNYLAWNIQLAIWTLGLSCLSITPYIHIIILHAQSPPSPPVWTYPFIRIFGSAISVVVAQMILQIRLQQITLMISESPIYPINDSNTLWSTMLLLRILQLLLFLGICSTAVGYLGCFTVVQGTTSRETYTWLGVEVALAVLRIFIWGWNPRWDERTGLRITLNLSRESPTITTGQDYFQTITLQKPSYLGAFANDSEAETFIIINDSVFLDYISPYAGPIARFSDPEHHLAIFYTLAGAVDTRSEPTAAHKVLLTTVLDLESQYAYVLAHHCGLKGQQEDVLVYAATVTKNQEMGLMMAKYKHTINPKHQFTKSDRFWVIDAHSRVIAGRLGGAGRVYGIDLTWGLDIDGRLTEAEATLEDYHRTPRLTEFDHTYLRSQYAAQQWRKDFYAEQTARIRELPQSAASFRSQDFLSFRLAVEWLLIWESFIFEQMLLEQTHPGGGFGKHAIYTDARRLEVYRASDARNDALAARLGEYDSAVPLRYSDVSPLEDYFIRDAAYRHIRDVDDDTAGLLRDTFPQEVLRSAFGRLNDRAWTALKREGQERLAFWMASAPSFKPEFVSAVFCKYSDSPGKSKLLLEVMLDRGCSVFDFCHWAKRPQMPGFPPALGSINTPASILNCPVDWISELITLAKSNSNILGVTFRGIQDHKSYTDLSTILSQNRHNWAANTPIPDGEDAIFWFGFPSESRAQGAFVSIPFSQEPLDTSILLFKTAEAGTFRVTLQNATTLEAAGAGCVAWRLNGAESNSSDAMELAPTDREGPEYRHASFTVEVPRPGIHQLDISFKSTMEPGGSCALRRVWVSRDGSGSFADEWIREDERPSSPEFFVPPESQEFEGQLEELEG